MRNRSERESVHFLVSVLLYILCIIHTKYRPWYVNPKTAEKIMKIVFESDSFFRQSSFSAFYFSHPCCRHKIDVGYWFACTESKNRVESDSVRVRVCLEERNRASIFACYFIYNWYPNIYKMPLSMISIRVLENARHASTQTLAQAQTRTLSLHLVCKCNKSQSKLGHINWCERQKRDMLKGIRPAHRTNKKKCKVLQKTADVSATVHYGRRTVCVAFA